MCARFALPRRMAARRSNNCPTDAGPVFAVFAAKMYSFVRRVDSGYVQAQLGVRSWFGRGADKAISCAKHSKASRTDDLYSSLVFSPVSSTTARVFDPHTCGPC